MMDSINTYGDNEDSTKDVIHCGDNHKSVWIITPEIEPDPPGRQAYYRFLSVNPEEKTS